MPGSAFIEDAETRISLLGRQALGVASLESGKNFEYWNENFWNVQQIVGWMEVILDRHLDQDDDRGLKLVVFFT